MAGCGVYGGGGIGANRGSWEGWLDGGLLKGCGAERRWSMVEQERDKGWPMRGNSILLERVGGWDSQRRNILRIRVASGHEFSAEYSFLYHHFIPWQYFGVSRCELDEEAKRDRIGGIGEAWAGARGKMRDPCCWSPCHDVTFPANLPGKDLDPIWCGRQSQGVDIDIEVEVRNIPYSTPYSIQ